MPSCGCQWRTPSASSYQPLRSRLPLRAPSASPARLSPQPNSSTNHHVRIASEFSVRSNCGGHRMKDDPPKTIRGPHRDLGEDEPDTELERDRDAMTTGILDRGALGRFTSLEPLGAGGMGIVLAAYDPQLDRRVAIKILRTRGITPERREKEAARLLREAKAMAQLSHPNVVTVYEAGTVDEHVFI